MGHVLGFGAHLSTGGAFAMKKFSVLFLRNYPTESAEFWIFHGQPQKIFNIAQEMLADVFQQIPKNLPCLVVLPTESASFTFEKINGFSLLSEREKKHVARQKLAAHFPKSTFQNVYFASSFDSAIFGVALDDSLFLAQLLATFEKHAIALLGITIEAFFLPFLNTKKTIPTLIFWEKNTQLHEIVVFQNTVLFARQTKTNADFTTEKERLRRFLHLSALASVNFDALPAATSFLNEATHAKTLLPFVPQVFRFAPPWFQMASQTFYFLPWAKAITLIAAFLFVLLTAFCIFTTNQNQQKIKTLESQIPIAAQRLAVHEWFFNQSSIAPYFLQNFPQNEDLFWQATSEQFEIFLPLTVENPAFEILNPQKTAEGLKIKGTRGDLP